MTGTANPQAEQNGQEMFCCALVKARGPKVHWLHVTTHDYWGRLEEQAAEIARLRTEVRAMDSLRAEIGPIINDWTDRELGAFLRGWKQSESAQAERHRALELENEWLRRALTGACWKCGSQEHTWCLDQSASLQAGPAREGGAWHE